MAALTGVTGTVVTIRSRPVILLRVDGSTPSPRPRRSPTPPRSAPATWPAFPDQAITCRILVESPRRGKARQQSNVRVR